MFTHFKLGVLMLVLTLHGHVYSIFGGREAKPHSHPYAVLVERELQDGKTGYCGGFLLNEDYVMTAARCQARSYRVFLGLHDYTYSASTQKVSVQESFTLADYSQTSIEYNLRLLKLSSKAKLSSTVKPIALADQDDVSPPELCVILGWGVASRKSKYMSTKLMEVNVILVDYEKCSKTPIYCSVGDTGMGAGDAGGPLVCKNKAYGVMSTTLVPGDAQNFTTIHSYTKIPNYRDWIDSVMGLNGMCYYM